MFPLRDNIPSRRWPFVNYLLIAMNAAAFAKQLQLARAGLLDPFIRDHALVPVYFLSDPFAHFLNIFTSMFLHGGWGHIVSNMWFLLIFGDNVEDAIGHI